MVIGILSDTHMPSSTRDLWPEMRRAFQAVDLILHGGDIFLSSVLDALEGIAPVLAARGNNDSPQMGPRVQECHILEIAGWRLGLIHDLEPEERPIPYLQRSYFQDHPVDIMVSGHTHFERLDYREGVLQVNPGSPTLPHQYSPRLGTVALLDIQPTRVVTRVVRLGETPGARNPGVEMSLTMQRKRRRKAVSSLPGEGNRTLS
jgi:putative phosphoesterase